MSPVDIYLKEENSTLRKGRHKEGNRISRGNERVKEGIRTSIGFSRRIRTSRIKGVMYLTHEWPT